MKLPTSSCSVRLASGKRILPCPWPRLPSSQENGAYFMTAHDLVTDLGRAYREARLDRRMRVYIAPKVLIIDEMGYLPLDDLGATIFFQLVSARYERGSIILTSNKSYGEWGSIFGDPIIATAILDRLLHHSTTINIRGERQAQGTPQGRTDSSA